MELSGIAYGAQIEAAAKAHGLDPKLLAAVAAQETGGPGASSGRNIVGDGGHGHGLFQIDDRSWSFASTPAAMDPAQNAGMAASILGTDLQQNGGNVRAALSAYNTGSPTATGTTTTWNDGSTLGYADSVLRHYADLGGSTDQLTADAGENAASVNALASFASTASAGSSNSAASDAAVLQAPPPLEPAFNPAPPINYQPAGQQANQSVQQQGDQALGDLVDASDALGDGDDAS